MNNKASLRQVMLNRLKMQVKEEKLVADTELLDRFLKTAAYQKAKRIATYLSFPHEFTTDLLIETAIGDGKQVYVPKTYSKGKMEFVVLNCNLLRRTAFGLLEPVEGVAIEKNQLDLIHVPGLLFTTQGYRLGYGAGYYDRYLADFQGDTISTVYNWQIGDFPVDSHDIPVKEVLISERIIR
ncbi:5-formyltetrahydrofolate cyclo-ligase [Streptococcus sp. DD10]|uniref:5-formyltetrahydrofolate cyclo-ligase n=1 Tax=Streptococcus sp. DD10 TaxID=1777878 RepID=UPI0007957DD9|nr:5-formyltetrahydrofolate cyclo-ligase [Streptococcus sp. DD10]KXT74843.1 5-formyltetrahydrofolate cyclo-ligase [Streptococcus sp. DD10]